MRVKNSVEQAICLLIIIAHSKDGKPLSWQNHFHTKDYVDEIKKYFSNVKIWKDIIVASN